MTGYARRAGRFGIRLGVAAWLGLGFVAGAPGQAAAQDDLTELDVSFAAGGRFAAAAESGGDFDATFTLSMVRLSETSDGVHFRAYGLELGYDGSEYLSITNIKPRIELDIFGGARLSGKSGEAAVVSVPYVALAGGYGWGSVWDNTYFDIYGTYEDVEIEISGVPFEAAVGYRRLGGAGLSFRAEAVAGLFLVTSDTPDDPRGSAPGIIPSIGLRVGIGFSTFMYEWR